MPIDAGTRLGPYEIIAPLGAGGMGEVYRARDSKLDREIAIKVLPALFAADPDRLRRFEREAKTLASLNHPNIAQVYGVIDQPPALIMELVHGEDLAERLKRGAIRQDEAIPIAKQIAEGLEAAHERGIIHRDLKPANIKIGEDGTVKVLDFGLAKAAVQNVNPVANDGVETLHDDPLMNSPTVTSAATLPGLILGTAAYMAPEQARGKIVDKRADIWAFGCVFYEMLTGYRAFAGNDVSDTLALILTKDADWRLLPAATTAPVRTLLRRCLQKDPRNRLRDLGDARLQLQEALDEPAATTVTGWHPPVMLLLAVSIALAAVMGAFDPILPWRQSHAETGVVRFSIVPPARDRISCSGIRPRRSRPMAHASFLLWSAIAKPIWHCVRSMLSS